MKAKDVFKSVHYGEPNLMTPEVIEYGQRGRYVYELSRGDFMGRGLFGVTVVDGIARARADNLSKCMRSLENARAYIESLKGES